MRVLQNKVILILSPQSWGPMHVSKHHYAIELAKSGNTVYFLNPPTYGGKNGIVIRTVSAYENLYVIDHSLKVPYQLRFHFLGIFHFYMKWHIKALIKAIGKPIDIIWSFDLGSFYPFKYFPHRSFKVFHPVDEPLNDRALLSARGCQVIFSVTNEILDKYKFCNAPRYFINHGVNHSFFQGEISEKLHSPIAVGFSGNLLRKDIDRDTLLKIFEENPDIMFLVWGSFDAHNSNIGGVNDLETEQFIQALKQLSNVRLKGLLPPSDLAKAYQEVDAFLICYDINKDQSKGTNYHKIMEFISTGKIIISNNVTTYQNRPDLIMMPECRKHNRELPVLFKYCIENLSSLNSREKIDARVAYAKDNSYQRQVERIDEILAKEIYKSDV